MFKVKTFFDLIYSNIDKKINQLIAEIEVENGVVQNIESKVCGPNNEKVFIIISYIVSGYKLESINDEDIKTLKEETFLPLPTVDFSQSKDEFIKPYIDKFDW